MLNLSENTHLKPREQVEIIRTRIKEYAKSKLTVDRIKEIEYNKSLIKLDVDNGVSILKQRGY